MALRLFEKYFDTLTCDESASTSNSSIPRNAARNIATHCVDRTISGSFVTKERTDNTANTAVSDRQNGIKFNTTKEDGDSVTANLPIGEDPLPLSSHAHGRCV